MRTSLRNGQTLQPNFHTVHEVPICALLDIDPWRLAGASSRKLIAAGGARPSSLPSSSMAPTSQVWDDAVGRSLFLRALSTRDLDYLQSRVTLTSMSAGHVLYKEESEPESFYIVKSGLYRATHGRKQDGSAGEHTVKLRDYQASD